LRSAVIVLHAAQKLNLRFLVACLAVKQSPQNFFTTCVQGTHMHTHAQHTHTCTHAHMHNIHTLTHIHIYTRTQTHTHAPYTHTHVGTKVSFPFSWYFAENE
jgi:hypothetical protein